jgi:hypothetical protein
VEPLSEGTVLIPTAPQNLLDKALVQAGGNSWSVAVKNFCRDALKLCAQAILNIGNALITLFRLHRMLFLTFWKATLSVLR